MITATVIGDKQLAAGLNSAAASLPTSLRMAMETSLLGIEADARRGVKQDTRRLMGSITHRISGAGTALVGEVGPSTGYGVYVEYGRRPGRRPPTSALLGWVNRRGLVARGRAADARSVAFLVARAIGRRGIRPAPFMQPALERNRARIEAAFDAVGAKVVIDVSDGS